MFKTFSKLAQANVDHYNNHTGSHNAITVAYGIVAVVAISAMSKKIANVPNN